jgi:Tol biopolymer transport system component
MKTNVFRAFAAAAIAVGTLIISPTAGAAQQSGHDGTIAYTETTNSGPRIRLLHPDGTSSTVSVPSAHHPVWSPQGRRLAFVADGHLYTADANGRHVQRMTNAPHASDDMPRWTPDGMRIGFIRTRSFNGQKRSALFTVQPHRLHETRITTWTDDTIGDFSWAPEGRRLVYEARTHDQRRLVVYSLRTHHSTIITTLSDDIPSHVSWAPTGRTILYADSATETYTIWPDGSRRTVISDGESHHAAWSPDAKRIAFLEGTVQSSMSIREQDDSITELPIGQAEGQKVTALAWSPDGSRLAFALQSSSRSGLFTRAANSGSSLPVQRAAGTITEVAWR